MTGISVSLRLASANRRSSLFRCMYTSAITSMLNTSAGASRAKRIIMLTATMYARWSRALSSSDKL